MKLGKRTTKIEHTMEENKGIEFEEPSPQRSLLETLPTAYEVRVVAFLDILGWREMIVESLRDHDLIPRMGSALTLLRLSGQHAQSIERSPWRAGTESDEHLGAQFTQFSDSMLISNRRDYLLGTLFQISSVIRNLFHSFGLLVRGAITVGPMYHRDSMAFGPALTHAYDLERTSAVFPRVILDPVLSALLPAEKDGLMYRFLPSMIRCDEDGFFFLDYLRPVPIQLLPTNMLQREEYWLETSIIPKLRNSRRFIENGMRTVGRRENILAKYQWLARYFNIVNMEYAQAKIDNLSAAPSMPPTTRDHDPHA